MRRIQLIVMVMVGLGGCTTSSAERGGELAVRELAQSEKIRPPVLARTECREPCATTDLLWCDPLDSAACSFGQGCYMGEESSFCANLVDTRGAGETCEFLNECAPGLTCINGQYVPGCTGPACCSSFCATTNDTCPRGQQCIAWLEKPPTECWETVGVCVGY